MKILFLATYPTQSNGYARVGNMITNYLSKDHEIHYFGFSNYPCTKIGRQTDESIRLIDVLKEEELRNNDETFGVGIIVEFMQMLKPDIVFIYNDIIVTCRHLNRLNEFKSRGDCTHPFRIINYLDLVYDFENPIFINHVDKSCDRIIAFSEYWKKNLTDMKVPSQKIDILKHGFDENLFTKIDAKIAKKLLGFQEDEFIILNTNRNSYRKAIDITISAFLLFLKRVNYDNKVKLILNCDMDNNSGYNLRNIIKTECMRHDMDCDLVMNNYIHTMGVFRLTDEKVNLLYNATDVGLNTCIGEGFGLCNLEHASLGKPQIVSNVGGLKDIFEQFPDFVINPVAAYNISSHIDGHNGLAYLCRAVDFSDRLYCVYDNYSKYIHLADKCSKYIKDNYNWHKVLEGFKI